MEDVLVLVLVVLLISNLFFLSNLEIQNDIMLIEMEWLPLPKKLIMTLKIDFKLLFGLMLVTQVIVLHVGQEIWIVVVEIIQILILMRTIIRHVVGTK